MFAGQSYILGLALLVVLLLLMLMPELMLGIIVIFVSWFACFVLYQTVLPRRPQ